MRILGLRSSNGCTSGLVGEAWALTHRFAGRLLKNYMILNSVVCTLSAPVR